ncbi:MAG: SAM-dependent DNA methyltransferase [Leptolyngbyaceae cyanobacterium CSU_1_4]|nr:SAM-dependent DNA methyltransferase [Leptolyngbyaceae cyanobacterium CSU_1_4]
MNTEKKPENRKFRGKSLAGRDQHYGVSNVYRYEGLFRDSVRALQWFDTVPFLNGGLFECLDNTEVTPPLRVDGFSDRADNQLFVPNSVFFAEEQEVDLNDTYNTKNKKYKVRGLIKILDRYKFTITENTPIEEEIALDPELLGKVFENLLASYNEETKATARKQTGSFYTPREVVDYMVNESLKVYLGNALAGAEEEDPKLPPKSPKLGL